ncbi:ABC transporter substrate-binding protein [Caballeronia sordidicola]|nr:ABC transporter substrate-binding protein [Caballeronia sordidicola]
MNMFSSQFLSCVKLAVAASLPIMVATPTHASTHGANLTYCSEGSPAGFDPAQYTHEVDFTANTFTIYNRLAEFERGGTKVVPGLAESWEVSPDGRTYTFHLRHNVKFQTTSFFKPTREFDADDVVFTFERMLDSNQPFHRAYPVSFPYFSAMGLDKLIAKIDKVDPYTVKFILNEPSAPFIHNIAMEYASVLSAEYANQLLKAGRPFNINQYPVGTGPFVFESYTKGKTIRFDGNPNYWKPGAVKLSKLTFAITPDPGVRVQKMENGECQVIAYSTSMEASDLAEHRDVAVLSQPGFQMLYVAYNPARKATRHAAIRRALDLAINRDAIVQAMYGGAGVAAMAPIPPTQWPQLPNRKQPVYAPQEARKLLRNKGHFNHFKMVLLAEPVFPSYQGEKSVAEVASGHRMMAEMLRQDWKKIGVDVTVMQYGWQEYADKIRSKNFDAVISGWRGDNGDPDNWFSSLIACGNKASNNITGFCDPQLDKLLDQARVESNAKRRQDDYLRAVKIFDNKKPFSPVSLSLARQPVSDQVTGLTIEPLGYLRFDGVGLRTSIQP